MNSKPIIVSTLTATVLACTAINVYAEPVSGTAALTYTQQQPTPIANADGNVLLAGEVHGKNKSTGGNSFMDGATVTNQEIAQLNQGNGIHAGYFTQVTDAGSTIAKWDGKVTTVMKDGNPMTSFKGKWDYVSGTGKYAGIKGSGDYNGYFTAKDSYVVEWKGDSSIAK